MEKPYPLVIFLVLMILVLIAHIIFVSLPSVEAGAQAQNQVALPLIGALFCMINAIMLLGPRRTFTLLGITVGISFTAEFLGSHYGLIFGHYTYGDTLGPKLAGVPLVVPLYWFLLVFLGYVISNLISQDKPDTAGTTNFNRDVWCALLGGGVVTAWDLGADPYLASPSVGAWTWTQVNQDTAFFGIPPSNFYGWVFVSALILFIMRRLDHSVFAKSGGYLDQRYGGQSPGTVRLGGLTPGWARVVALIPVLYYASFVMLHMGHDYSLPLRVVSMIALGVPAMAAISNWRNWEIGTRRVEEGPS